MTNLLIEAMEKAQSLPDHLQDEIAAQLIDDIENELSWQRTLSQPQGSKLEELAMQALENSKNGKTKIMGFDEL